MADNDSYPAAQPGAKAVLPGKLAQMDATSGFRALSWVYPVYQRIENERFGLKSAGVRGPDLHEVRVPDPMPWHRREMFGN
jgi:hypothetical protein